MHVTKPPERTNPHTWSPPPRTPQHALAHRAAAALVALTLGLGGSLMMVGTASAEELVDPAPIVNVTDPGVTDPGATAPGTSEPPADGVEGPVAPEVPEVTEPEVTEPEVTDPEVTESDVTEPAAIDTAKLRDDDETIKKVQFCHWKPAEKNPYEFLDTSVNAFFNSGHNDHANDIVPPFTYSKFGEPMSFPGLNWNPETEKIWDNECEITKPTMVITPVQCVPGGESGGVTVSLYGLKKGEHYTVGIRDKDKDPIDGIDDESFTATNSTKTIEFSGLPAPGKYWAFFELDHEDYTLSQSSVNGEMKPIWMKFTLDECPPLIPTVVVDPVVCTVEGGKTSTATISLGSLTIGEEYRLSVYDDHAVLVSSFTPLEFEADAATKQVTVTGLPAPGTYRVVLEWMDEKVHDGPADMSEQSIVRPPKEELHTIEVWFSLAACPAPKPTLAYTGFDGSSLPLGLGLLTIGTALMLATRMMRREQLFPPMV